MIPEPIDDWLAAKEPQIRSKTAKAISGFGLTAVSALSLWLAPTLGLKLALISIGILLWIVAWLVSLAAFHRKEIRRLRSEIGVLQGTELDRTDLTVLECVFEPHPDRYEMDEIVTKTGLSLRDVSLSLRRLMALKHIGKNLSRQMRSPGGINLNGFWITQKGESVVRSRMKENEQVVGEQPAISTSIS
jgi:hypothetical protein